MDTVNPPTGCLQPEPNRRRAGKPEKRKPLEISRNPAELPRLPELRSRLAGTVNPFKEGEMMNQNFSTSRTFAYF
jgi:hypothetical protein